MRCALPTVVGLLTLAAPLASQAKPGHVYGISYYQALPGKAAAYNKALAGAAPEQPVTVRSLQSLAETQDESLLNAVGAYEAKRNEATQAVHHKAWSEAIAGFPDLRRAIRSETYQPVGQ